MPYTLSGCLDDSCDVTTDDLGAIIGATGIPIVDPRQAQRTAVTALQRLLAGYYTGAYNGIYTMQVEQAFKAWAAGNGLDFNALLTGTISIPSLFPGDMLGKIIDARNASGVWQTGSTPARAASGSGFIRNWRIRGAVNRLQRLLAGYYTGRIDGIYGSLTEQAFQAWAVGNGLDFNALLTGAISIPSLFPGDMLGLIIDARNASGVWRTSTPTPPAPRMA